MTGQKFWCFSHQHQSDPNEFEYSLMIARDVIRQIGTSADFFTHHFCGCLDDLLEHNRLSGPFEFYLSSFSRHRDHGPQWKEYGDGGKGFAIGLAPSLLQPDIDALFPEANKNLHIGRVVYGDADTSARHREAIAMAAEITTRVGMANTELVRTAGPSHYLVTMARELLAQQLIWNCLTAKEQRYHAEREVRGIIMNVKANFDPYRKTFNKRTTWSTPSSLKFLEPLLKFLWDRLLRPMPKTRSGTSFETRVIPLAFPWFGLRAPQGRKRNQ